MRVLLLDIDGVLQFPRAGFVEAIEREHRWRHGYLAFQDALFADPAYLRSLVGDGDFVRVADRLLGDHVEGLTGAAFLSRWLDGNITLNHTLRDLVPGLGFDRVYLASNQEPSRGAHVERLHGDQRWVSGSFLSHRVGYRKPDPRYFAHILRTVGGQPADYLFVDDNDSCVAGAAAVGITGVRFVDNDQVVSDIHRHRQRSYGPTTDDGVSDVRASPTAT